MVAAVWYSVQGWKKFMEGFFVELCSSAVLKYSTLFRNGDLAKRLWA